MNFPWFAYGGSALSFRSLTYVFTGTFVCSPPVFLAIVCVLAFLLFAVFGSFNIDSGRGGIRVSSLLGLRCLRGAEIVHGVCFFLLLLFLHPRLRVSSPAVAFAHVQIS